MVSSRRGVNSTWRSYFTHFFTSLRPADKAANGRLLLCTQSSQRRPAGQAAAEQHTARHQLQTLVHPSTDARK